MTHAIVAVAEYQSTDEFLAEVRRVHSVLAMEIGVVRVSTVAIENNHGRSTAVFVIAGFLRGSCLVRCRQLVGTVFHGETAAERLAKLQLEAAALEGLVTATIRGLSPGEVAPSVFGGVFMTPAEAQDVAGFQPLMRARSA